jgi:hypothetical protein
MSTGHGKKLTHATKYRPPAHEDRISAALILVTNDEA